MGRTHLHRSQMLLRRNLALCSPKPSVRNAWKTPAMTSIWKSGQSAKISNLPNPHLNGQVDTMVSTDLEKGKRVAGPEEDEKEVGRVWGVSVA